MKKAAITPREMVDAFMSFGKSERDEFVRLFSKYCPQSVPRDMIRHFTVATKKEMLGEMYDRVIAHVLPVCYQQAILLFRENPHIQGPAYRAIINDRVQRVIMQGKQLAAQEEREKFENKRNRKHSEAIVRRNVEICKLKDQGKSIKFLVKKYGFKSNRSITKIFSERSMWIKLESELNHD